MKTNRKHGFTIVELVVVIAIIAVLAAVLIPTFISIVKKANDSAYLQERTNQQIADLAEKVENLNYFTWEDFEKKLAEELAKVGDTDTEAIQKAVDAAIAKYSDSSQTGNTGLTEAQVKKIVEEAMKGQLTTAQVEAIVRQVLSGTTVSEETIRTIVNNAVKGMSTTGVTKAQVEQAIKAAISGTIAVNDEQLEAAVTNALKAFGVSTITDQQVEEIVSNLKNVITINEEAGFSTGSYAINPDDANKVFYLVTDAALESFTITGSTDKTTIIIDAPNIKKVTIEDDAKVLRVLRTADESTHIKGTVTTLEVNSGRVVIEDGATVTDVKAAPAKQATVTIVLKSGSEVTNLNSEFQYYAGTNDYIKIIDEGATIGNSFITSSSAVTTSTTTNVVLSGAAFVDGDNNPTVENKSSVSADIKVNDTTYTSDGETSDLMLFAGGTGTDGDPYLIATAAQWNNFYQTVYDFNKENKVAYFALANDIDLAGFEITNYAVDGETIEYDLYMNFVLDGKDKKLSGIETLKGYGQLFPNLDNSTIKNITIDYKIVNSTRTTAMAYDAVGECYFTNVTTTGEISTSANWATAFVAYSFGSNNIYYTNCTNMANIKGGFGNNAYIAVFGSHNGGGVHITFDNCKNYGGLLGGYVGFVGMGNDSAYTFVDENAVQNYGSMTGTKNAGYFRYDFTAASKTIGGVTCEVKKGSALATKSTTHTNSAPANFGDAIVLNEVSGAVKYEVEMSFSIQVYNYDDNSNANKWSGGFPRSMVLTYSADDVENGKITTDFKKGYVGEVKAEQYYGYGNTTPSYDNGVFVPAEFDISSANVVLNQGDIYLVEDNGDYYYVFYSEQYHGWYTLLTTNTSGSVTSTQVTVSFSVTAYNPDGSVLSFSSFNYGSNVADAKAFFTSL